MLREAQLPVAYPNSPIIDDAAAPAPGPRAGERAPDARGLRTSGRAFPLRLFELLRGPQHTLLCYADTPDDLRQAEALAAALRERFDQPLRVRIIVPKGLATNACQLPVAHDEQGDYRDAYAAHGGSVYMIRPDGHIGYRASAMSAEGVCAAMARVWA